jgi:GntR family transcriptional repressor for pyruvate dehydrogenase complex
MATEFYMEPVRNARASRTVAEVLREAILTGELKDGAVLPSERDLAGQADVSRGSVREALRGLEAEGLIEVRAGRSGGAVVRVPGPHSLGRPVAAFLRGAGLDNRPLVETLLVLEPAIAAIAAETRTDEDLAKLSDLVDRMVASPDHVERVMLNADWHTALAEATHNPILAGILSGLAEAIRASTTDVEAFAADGVRERTVASYRSLLEALEAQDANAAETLMFRHITAASKIATKYRARHQQLLG